jgi:hypothetical protein
MMDKILAGLEFSFVYLDNILVASKSSQDHHAHLRTVFERLQADGLVLNQKKCLFAVSSLGFSRPPSISSQHCTPGEQSECC